MAALLTGTFEEEDVFREVENDEDFIGKEGTSSTQLVDFTPMIMLE